MKQYEQVIETMDSLGGYATLGQLYQCVDVSGWRTQSPYASIRRIVQDTRFFFNIRPGLWALKTYKNQLPDHISSMKNIGNKKCEENGHYYYQGLLLEIGNLKNYKTFVPHQDKNKKFLDKTLGETRTLDEFYPFSHSNLVRQAKTVDVSWFNSRKMPEYLFEIEHSTSMDRSLIKFNELTDFNIHFFIVSDKSKKRAFDSKMKWHTFKSLKERVKFYDYERLSKWHTNCFEDDTVAPPR